MRSAINSVVSSGGNPPADLSQNADGANVGSRGSVAPNRARFHRGRRAGVALRARREVEQASRELMGQKHVAKEAHQGSTGMISYRDTDQFRLQELLNELMRIADEKVERELFPAKEADIRTFTDDWSNVHLWNTAIAHYVFMSSKIPNLYKQVDIIEYLTYIQMVIDLRLIRQRNVSFRHPMKVENLFDIPDPILMQSVLPTEVVNFMETLRPVYGKEGGILYFMPYNYSYSYSQNPDQTEWTQPMTMTPEFVYHDRIIEARGSGRNHRDGYHEVTKIDLVSSRVVNAQGQDVNQRFNTKRLNIYALIDLRRQFLLQGRKEVLAQEFNAAIGYDLFTRAFSLNVNRLHQLSDGQIPHNGSLLSGETCLYPTLTRIFNQLSLNYFTSFNVEVWRPTIRPLVIEKTQDDGKLKFLPTTKPSGYISTPFVIKSGVSDEEGLKILDTLRHRGLECPSRWKTTYITTIGNMRMYLESHISGVSNLSSFVKEWHESSALG